MLGLHFFMPAHLVPLVEVVMADTSDEASADALIAFMKRCGSVPVKVRQDLPGFLANRCSCRARGLRPDRSRHRLARGSDAAVRFGFGFRFLAAGPVMQRDHAGIEVHGRRRHHVPHVLQRGPPARCLAERAADGRHGMKTGEGFTPGRRDHRRRARADRCCAPAWT